MLMLCLTGLPLIFHDEIESLLEEDQALPEMPAGTPLKSLDEALQTALDTYPGERGLFMSFDVDRPVVNVTTGGAIDVGTDAHHLNRFAQRGNRRCDYR